MQYVFIFISILLYFLLVNFLGDFNFELKITYALPFAIIESILSIFIITIILKKYNFLKDSSIDESLNTFNYWLRMKYLLGIYGLGSFFISISISYLISKFII